MPRGGFILAFIPLGVPGSVARSLTLICINSQSLLFQIFLLFLWLSSNVHVVPFRVVPPFLHTLFYFCPAVPVLFSLLFSIGGLYWYILRDYLFNYVHSYNKLIKNKVKPFSRVLLFVDCSLPDSPVHMILQARILEWVAISFSMGLNPGLLHCRQTLYPLIYQGCQSLSKLSLIYVTVFFISSISIWVFF